LLDSTIYSPKLLDQRDSREEKINWFILIACIDLFPTYTSTKYVDLVWENFANFYSLIYFTITLFKHAIYTFPNLLHFLDSWHVKEKGIQLVGLERTLPCCWRLAKNNNNHEFECALKLMKQHARLTSNGQGKFAPCS
jgi:hypothetical protein